MKREDVEALIKAKIENEDADTGLQYVVLDITNDGNGDQMTFTWFDNLRTVDELVTAYSNFRERNLLPARHSPARDWIVAG